LPHKPHQIYSAYVLPFETQWVDPLVIGFRLDFCSRVVRVLTQRNNLSCIR